MYSTERNGLTDRHPRQSNFELLRIVAMLMIVFHHFAFHGELSYEGAGLSAPHLWYNLIIMDGKTGVNIFVLISGYFLVNDKELSLKRLLKLWGEVSFYAVVLNFVFTILGFGGTGTFFFIKTFAKTLLPVTFQTWWFASAYFVLYLLHTFLNRFIRSLDQRAFQTFLITVLTCWCIIPTITTSDYQSNNLLWFVTLYCVAGYVRIFGANLPANRMVYLAGWGISSLIRYLLSVILTVLAAKTPLVEKHVFYFNSQHSVFTFLSAFCLFMFFERSTMSNHKWINRIASATFGVYLIHENEFVRSFLWGYVFRNTSVQNSMLLIPYSIAAVGAVFVVCVLIDLIRQATVEAWFLKKINRYSDSWKQLGEAICARIRKKT